MFNTYHAKLQVFMSTRSVINWAIVSGFGRPPLQNSNLAGNNWESWGGRGSDVIQSRQQKQLGYFSMGQVSSWKVFAVGCFLPIRSKFELNSSVTRVYQLVVVLCRIATTVQTREKEFLYIILLPAAVFYQVGRDLCPHIARTSTQPAVLLFAPSISMMTVLPGLIMWEHPWNALYKAQFPQYGRKNWKRYTFSSLLRFNISLLH